MPTIATRIPQLLLLLLALSSLLESTQAAGGFFGRAAPEEPVTSTNDAIVFGVQGNTVTMQVQLEYQESSPESSDFAWILPIPAAPTSVEMGSSLLMDALYEHTRPEFTLEIHNATMLQQDPKETTLSAESKQLRPFAATASSTCNASALVMDDCPTNEGPSRGNSGGFSAFGAPSPIVIERGTAGIIDYTVLQGDGATVIEWLANNSYTFPEDTMDLEAQLDYYVSKGHVFVAVQLQPDAPEGAMQPLMVQYELPEESTEDRPNLHSVPLFLSQAQNLTLNVYFLTDTVQGRAVPVNYLDLTLDDSYVDWVGCYESNEGGDVQCYQGDYEMRFQTVVQSMENHTLVTEYAGPSASLNGLIMTDDDWELLQGLNSSATWLDFLTVMEHAGVPDNERVQQIITEHVPLTFKFELPFQCAQWKQLYHPNFEASPNMEDCFAIYDPPANFTWDAEALADDLFEHVFVPAQEAQSWLDEFQWLTRFLGYIPDTSSITKEPYFVIQPNKTLVSRHHRATAVPVCADGSRENPTSLEITLMPREKKDAENDVVTFWQPAVLTCPTWQKTAPGIVWDSNEALPISVNYAESFTAHGIANHQGVEVSKNHSSSDDGVVFDPEDLMAAIQFGDTLMKNLTMPAV